MLLILWAETMNIGGLYFEPLSEELNRITKSIPRKLRIPKALKITAKVVTILLRKASELINKPIEKLANADSPREVIHKVMLWHKVGLAIGIASIAILTYLF